MPRPRTIILVRALALACAAGVAVLAAQTQSAAPDAAVLRERVQQAQALLTTLDNTGAIAAFERALPLALSSNDAKQAAACYRGIGLGHYRQGHIADAADAYHRGVEYAERAGDKALMAELLRGIGNTERAAGHHDAALTAAERSLALSREIGDERSAANMLTNIAILFGDIGDTRHKAALIDEQIRIAEANGFEDVRRSGYDNLATVYMAQGDDRIALGYLEKNLTLKQDAHVEGRSMAVTLTNMAVSLRRLGESARALDMYKRSLALLREAGDERRAAIILVDLGIFYRLDGKNQEALVNAAESVRLFEKEQNPIYAEEARTDLALVHLALGENETALAEGRKAAAFARSSGNPPILWMALDVVGEAARRLGMRDEARRAFTEEVATLERARLQFTSGDSQGAGFLDDKMNPYQGLIRLEVEDRHPAEALRVAEQAKARQLFDIIRSGHVPMERSLTAGEAARERGLAAEAAQSPSDEAGRALDAYRATLYTRHPELQLQRAEFQAVPLTDAVALMPDAHTAFVEYSIGADQLFLFVLTRAPDGGPSLDVHTIAWRLEDLQRDVEAFRAAIAARDLGYRARAASLYRRLLQPAAAALAGKTLVGIVPDGPLWNLPFEALVSSSGRHVLEDHAVFYAPSLTLLHESRRLPRVSAASRPTLLAMGDPEFAALRLDLPRLPASAREMRQLSQLYGPRASAVFTGGEASEDRWKEQAPRYSVIHLATHGVLNSVNPLSSFLVLHPGAMPADDGRLEAREILDMSLHADLAVLSACDTARGRFNYGEGIMGISWAFLVAGSPATVVSQWQVDAESTRQLMLAFHRRLLRGATDHLTGKAVALQRAALTVMRTSAFSHPFYWAPFILVGDGY